LKYYFSSEYEAVTNLLGKAISFSILGCLTEALIESLPIKNGSRPIWIAGFAMSVVAILIEIGQIYVQGQIADITDVLSYIFGGFAGLLLLRHVLHGLPDLRQELPLSEDQIPVKTHLETDAMVQSVSWFKVAIGVGLLADYSVTCCRVRVIGSVFQARFFSPGLRDRIGNRRCLFVDRTTYPARI
jgi:hypothetical protein